MKAEFSWNIPTINDLSTEFICKYHNNGHLWTQIGIYRTESKYEEWLFQFQKAINTRKALIMVTQLLRYPSFSWIVKSGRYLRSVGILIDVNRMKYM